MKSFSINEIKNLVNGNLIFEINEVITGLETVDNATIGQATFIGHKKFAKNFENSKASVVIVSEGIELKDNPTCAQIKVTNADLAMAKLLEAFSPETPSFISNISPVAVIDKSAIIGKNVKVGAGCYVGKNTVVEDNVTLYPNVTVFDDCKIGQNTIVWSGTVIRERSEIGAHCIFHNNVSIGADGFGYRPSDDGRSLVKIPHIGNVIIGNNVEIGANSCVDRAKFSSTIIGDGCKIDNLVQIAHNCILGRSCIMAGSSGLAGSVTLGDGVIIGGSASIKDHTTIHSGAIVGAGSGVLADVPAGKTVLGYPATDAKEKMKQWVALRKLGRA
ncbi:UDP-3-O-(3-hydroxymyristoyl)glucosamine N-acyltransferase [Aurantibacter sp.]|uniref:UDP-3-O-(3-hydroxymyristoyl)glucosamine N-acyltransferase n=1 Tax=Aurantibacter sp. TaxID=2807103 RepID=UPI0035C82572